MHASPSAMVLLVAKWTFFWILLVSGTVMYIMPGFLDLFACI